MIYFTADTHFYHENIIRLCQRPFEDVQTMNEMLIENWNSCVTDNDEIYILGDLVYKGKGREANEILKALKGKKYLIRGNHEKYLDDPAFKTAAFEWVKDYYVLFWQKRKFVLCHYPIFEWEGYFHDSIHLYGHVHNGGGNAEYQERFRQLGSRAINVGVDVQGYRPVSINQVIEMADSPDGGRATQDKEK
jgi:calcineurin-like phosphoesterase family protein